MSIIKLDQNLDPTFSRATTANYKDLSATAAASGVIRYENVVDAIVVDTKREWDRGTHSNTSGHIDNTLNLVNTSASGQYTSEWLNGGVSGMVYSSHAVASSGTVSIEFRGTDSDTQASPSSWSATKPSTKYIQFRLNLTNGSPNPVVASVTLTPTSLGKAATIEEATVNILVSPTAPATQDVTVTASGDYALSIYGTDAASGTCVIEHKLLETTTADFSTGTLKNVQAISNTLTIVPKSAPVFARATSATNYDGSTTASGNIRYALGKNLISLNQSNCASGWEIVNNNGGNAAWSYSGNSIVGSVGTTLTGEAYVEIQAPGIQHEGRQCTFSVTVNITGHTTGNINMSIFDTVGGSASPTTQLISNGNTSGRFSVTRTIRENQDNNSLALRFRVVCVAGVNAGTSITITAAQVEYAATPSTWVQGGNHAVIIEEAATNLLPAGAENINTPEWANAASFVRTTGRPDPFGGTGAIRINTTGGATAYKWYTSYTPSIGQKYSVSIWVKNNDVTNAITVNDNHGHIVSISNSDGWKLVTIDNTTAASTMQIVFSCINAATNLDADIMWPMIVQSPITTSYITPGTTRNLDALHVSSTSVLDSYNYGTIFAEFYLNSLNPSDFQTILDIGGTGSSGLILFTTPGTNTIRLQYGTTIGLTAIVSSSVLTVNSWHKVAVKWGTSGAKLFLNGFLEASDALTANVVGNANYYIGSNSESSRFLNGRLDTLVLFREELTDVELLSMTASSGSINIDRRTGYDLRFINDLNHGEGGYRTTVSTALDNIGTIGGSNISWSAVGTGTADISVETSIDNGSTWSATTNGTSITGLTDGVSSTGKNLIIRQAFTTQNANSDSPILNDIEHRITQKWANTSNTYIKPIYTTVRFTPTNLTKFQLENKKYSTSFYNGTRNNDSLTLAAGVASGVINGASGAVVVRYYDDGDTTLNRNRILFSCAKASSTSGAIYLYQVLGGSSNQRCYISSDSATLYIATNNNILSRGWHTIGMRWSTSNIAMWIDGAFAGSGAVSASPTIGATHVITVGNNDSATASMSTQISQVDIFSETLTDAEMAAYTAATGAVIPVGIKHSYQMKFEDSLAYGTCGKFTSRWQDAGSNCAGTPWVTYSKVDSTPGTTSITYQFKASDDQDDSDSWTTDITSITGRYIKVRFNLISEDVDANTPTITSFRAYPEYS